MFSDGEAIVAQRDARCEFLNVAPVPSRRASNRPPCFNHDNRVKIDSGLNLSNIMINNTHQIRYLGDRSHTAQQGGFLRLAGVRIGLTGGEQGGQTDTIFRR